MKFGDTSVSQLSHSETMLCTIVTLIALREGIHDASFARPRAACKPGGRWTERAASESFCRNVQSVARLPRQPWLRLAYSAGWLLRRLFAVHQWHVRLNHEGHSFVQCPPAIAAPQHHAGHGSQPAGAGRRAPRGKQFNSIIQAQVDQRNGASREDILMAAEDAKRLGRADGAAICCAKNWENFAAR
jgi:hypothetical protein